MHIQGQFADALYLFEHLTDNKKAELTKSAEDIRAVQQGLAQQIKSSGMAETCRVCQGECCLKLNEERIFTPEYFLSLLLSISASERQKIQDVIMAREYRKNPDGEPLCIFAGEAGCTLPEDLKPSLCITFFCKKFPKADAINKRFQSLLKPATDRFNQGMFKPITKR